MHKQGGGDDKKLQASLKKMNVQPIQAIEEVNMFKEDGNVIHFAAPKGRLDIPVLKQQLGMYQMVNDLVSAVHASVPSNTFAIYGNGEEKELTELVPGILNQLGTYRG